MVMVTKVILMIDDDKDTMRGVETRHGASTSRCSSFRGGPDLKEGSDIFVYHVASDVTVGDVKALLIY